MRLILSLFIFFICHISYAQEMRKDSVQIKDYEVINFEMELKKFKDAEISLRKAIEIDPNSIIGYANLGNMLKTIGRVKDCLLYTSPSPRDRQKSRMPSSA